MKSFLRATALLIFLSLAAFGGESPTDAAKWGRENIAAGKYKEAIELLTKELPNLKEPDATRREVVFALVEAQRIVGKFKEAREVLEKLLADVTAAKEFKKGSDTDIRMLLAEIDIDTGRYKEARETFDKIIADEPANQRAWALRSIVLRELGDAKTLAATADHFFEFNAKSKKDDPLELAYTGLGVQDENPKSAFEAGFMPAEEMAGQRGLKLPEIFLWSARLALSKYSFGNADTRFGQLLQMRPKLPDALAGHAAIVYQSMHKLDDVEKTLKEALEVNPSHIDSLLLMAQVDLEEERYDDAKKHIDAALAVNPNHSRGLSLLALYCLDMNQADKFAEVESRAKAVKPVCPDFYCDIGEMMENKRGFNTAAPYYKKAIELDPEYWRGYYGLGMNTSRQGAYGEEPGKEMLLKAFSKNKFNLWALNMIKSLDRIIGDKEQGVKPVYAESKTEHFTLKFFGKEAEIVRPYLEEWAENAYTSQQKKFNYTPEGPLTIELCYNFQDQAARTVGLPNLGALGVCFGKLCTVVSPREGTKDHPPFNWRKVIEHEFGHVMVLQMSDFRVPRWYTEAFSTYLEDDSRIQSDRMMIDAIAKGEIKDLNKMNEYFRGNMLMAYVHGRYVIEYIDKKYGFDAHIKAVKLFAKGKKLEEALQEATGASLDELNKGQHEFVKQSFKDVRLRPSFNKADVVKQELAAKAENASAQDIVNLAISMMSMRKFTEATALADQALAKDAKCVDAINVLGTIAYEKQDFEAAKQQFQKSTGIDPDKSFNAWHKLGVIYKKEGKTTKAIAAFEAARKSYPRYVGADSPHHELPDLYADLEPPQLDKALQVWRDCVKINSEDKEAALEGLKLAMKMKDYKSAAEFASAHIEIDPYVLDVHKMAGQAYTELKDYAHAAREYKVASVIDAQDVDNWLNLAKAYKALGNKEEALKAANQAHEIDQTLKEAKELIKELEGK
ncbi:MAG TPA: tetratricopeptide repeat protein [Planctomycetota bacterium]|nr:tetratricopeptide repeat protein [Planctomycetota bacterium]